MSKRDELKNARDAAIDTIEPYRDDWMRLQADIDNLTGVDYSGFAADIGNFYPDAFTAANAEKDGSYLFGNFQSSFDAAIQQEVASQGVDLANITSQELLMYRQEEKDLLLSNIGPLHNAPELHVMMEETIAIMNQEGNSIDLQNEIAQCQMVLETIEYNDTNLETNTPTSVIKLCAADIAIESGYKPSIDYMSGMLAEALNEDITHAINTGQKFPASDIHEALDSCSHIDQKVRDEFANAIDHVAEADNGFAIE